MYTVCSGLLVPKIRVSTVVPLSEHAYSRQTMVGWLVGLEFNGAVNTAKVMSSRPVYLIMLIADRLSPLSG